MDVTTSAALKMIKKGSSIAMAGNGEKTAVGVQLRQAADKGNLEELKSLLAAGAPLVKDQVRLPLLIATIHVFLLIT